VEEWHIPGKTASKRVRYLSQTQTIQRLSSQHQTVLAMFLKSKKPFYNCTEGMGHSSTRPGTSLHMSQFYQAFPHVITASDKCWGEKAWVQGYQCYGDSITVWIRNTRHSSLIRIEEILVTASRHMIHSIYIIMLPYFNLNPLLFQFPTKSLLHCWTQELGNPE